MEERTGRARGAAHGGWWPNLRLPLRGLGITLVVMIVVLSVGIVAYVSFRSARADVSDVARQLRRETAARIEDRLREFLRTPHILNEVNADLIGRGALDADDLDALTAHFWKQVQAAPSVTSVYFGNASGGIADAGREGAGGALYLIVTDGFVAGTFRKYATNEVGGRTSLLQEVPGFDARARAWYTGAVARGGPAWSDIYLLFSGQDMAISASRPVVNGRGELLGVVAADLFLAQVGDFLRQLDVGANGRCFVMERSGLLIASSADASPILYGEPGQAPRRLSASESSSPVIRAAVASIQKEWTAEPGGGGQLDFAVDGEHHLLQVVELADGHGIEWLVGVAIPERELMARVDANTRTTIVLVFVAGALAVALGVGASRWVTEPLRRLELSARALSSGEREVVSEASRIVEVASLSRSFNVMSKQLEQTVTSLQAEVAERTKAESELRESEARYRLLADNATDVIWTMNLEGRFTYMSPSVEKLRGYTPEEVMSLPFSAALTPESASSAEALYRGMHRRIEQALPSPEQEHFELEQPCKDGSTVWTDTVISLMEDDRGRPIGLLGVSRNITARKHAEEERLALEAQLRHSQKLESIGTLASGVAHEINNPLTGVINYADLIGRRTGDAQLRDFAEGIKTEGNRMAEIVRGLLSFARQGGSEKQPERMADIVRASLMLIGAMLRRDRIELRQRIDEDLPLVRCNAQQIEQIFINLLTNARDALNRKYPGGDENKVIEIEMRRIEKDGVPWVRTTVEDHGSGVPADLLGRLFDPFFTTKPRDMGTGLGLSISYGIAQDHGGELTVESEEGRYTRFHLDLRAEPE